MGGGASRLGASRQRTSCKSVSASTYIVPARGVRCPLPVKHGKAVEWERAPRETTLPCICFSALRRFSHLRGVKQSRNSTHATRSRETAPTLHPPTLHTYFYVIKAGTRTGPPQVSAPPPRPRPTILAQSTGDMLRLPVLGRQERGLRFQQPGMDKKRAPLGQLLQVGVPHRLQLSEGRPDRRVRLHQRRNGDDGEEYSVM